MSQHRTISHVLCEVLKSWTIVSILLISTAASAEEWHRVGSSSCLQVKAKGAKVSGRPFSVFEAPNSDSKCCEGLILKASGKTEALGHFRILGLDRGHYFLNLDLKTKQVTVPISVEYFFDRRDVRQDCEPNYKITVDKRTNEVKWEESILLD